MNKNGKLVTIVEDGRNIPAVDLYFSECSSRCAHVGQEASQVSSINYKPIQSLELVGDVENWTSIGLSRFVRYKVIYAN